MNGPAHYREAERLLDKAQHYTDGDGGDPVTGAAFAAEAQAHATLALAAATALPVRNPNSPGHTAWVRVAHELDGGGDDDR